MNKLHTRVKEIMSSIKTRGDLNSLNAELISIFDEKKLEENQQILVKTFEQLEFKDVSETEVLKEISQNLDIPMIELLKLPHENLKDLKQEVVDKKQNKTVDEFVEVFKEVLTPYLRNSNEEINWMDMVCKFMISSQN